MLFLSALIGNTHPNFAYTLKEQINSVGSEFGYLTLTNDIWIRDFMPIQVGPAQFVQFSLTKDYYYQNDHHKWTNPAPICKSLGIDPVIPTYNGQPIYLDGGNVIRGYGKAIITEKVFSDNRIPRDDLTNILIDVLQVNQVVFIPVEPGDDTGHADGMVRFVDEHTVVATEYSGIEVSKKFKDRFYGTLAESGLDVLHVPYHPVNKRVDGLWVALGCYINFLMVDSKIFMPTFDNKVEDDIALVRFEEIFGSGNVIPVPSKEVAMGGGVLNCLTWEINPI
jgi:agmatine deiminase